MSTPSGSPAAPERLVSLDAFRGLTMLFMASSGLGIAQIAQAHPGSAFWDMLRYNTSHAAWIGGGAWDMIQPAFMFMVGMALPFSSSRRTAEGHDQRKLWLHTLWRAFVLVFLGVFLSTSAGSPPNFVFPNVLAQIGLGYVFVTLLVGRGWKIQVGAITTIAVATWTAFVLAPVAGTDADLRAVGVSADLAKEAVLPGFFAHWTMNANVASGFDQWFLNLFPRQTPHVFNNGGYTTLNFVPAIITMTLGLMAGEALRSERSSTDKLRWLLRTGAICLALGVAAGLTLCPIVKRLWTPSWALFSGGVVLWAFAAFYWFIDLKGRKTWTLPLVVVGMNSIAIYLAYQLTAGWIRSIGKTWLGIGTFGGEWSAFIASLWVLAVLWTFCYWLYRRKLFLRI
jgi:heparan-alpha-glucosaminide N-acetyltransferase